MISPYENKFRVSQEFKGSAHDGLDLVGIDSKEVHSTVDGVVEKAGWESALNHKKGFGLYVRIKKDASNDKYYFGHLSSIKVKAGQRVKVGDILGIEGSTGFSTGSHCHYCIRGNGLRSQVRNVSEISGIPNQLGTYDGGSFAMKKSISQLAQEVINGLWGNGEERKQRLLAEGYNYSEVQMKVNEILSESKKSNYQIAREVIAGKWGNGEERRRRLTDAGYDYTLIQREVNKLI